MQQCIFCGNTNYNDLRPLFVDSNGKLYNGYYKPRLTPQELWKLKAKGKGEHWVCFKRTRCKKLQV